MGHRLSFDSTQFTLLFRRHKLTPADLTFGSSFVRLQFRYLSACVQFDRRAKFVRNLEHNGPRIAVPCDKYRICGQVVLREILAHWCDKPI